MKKNVFLFLTVLLLSLFTVNSFSYGQSLDPEYKKLKHQRPFRNHLGLQRDRSQVEQVIAVQSPIRSQQARGTCSIFSATALLESMLISARQANQSIDLSEEWLQYVVTRGKTTDGSDSPDNFAAISNLGMAAEKTLPYIGETWKDLNSSATAAKRCGYITDPRWLKSCLIGHRDAELLGMNDTLLSDPATRYYDPAFVSARHEAAGFKQRFLPNGLQDSIYVQTTQEARNLLKQGIPLTLGLDFYYGAWNHRKATELGIDRDEAQWQQGIVFYPVPGSLDLQNSSKSPAGHSIVVVGYDDNIVLSKNIKMVNGSVQNFQTQGVYYFKNSWGTEQFGKNFAINNRNFPGYGMISQEYAHKYGAFHKLILPVNQRPIQ